MLVDQQLSMATDPGATLVKAYPLSGQSQPDQSFTISTSNMSSTEVDNLAPQWFPVGSSVVISADTNIPNNNGVYQVSGTFLDTAATTFTIYVAQTLASNVADQLMP